MFYLTTHSTHFTYGYMASGIIMVKDHLGDERKTAAVTTWSNLSDEQQLFIYLFNFF